VKLLDLSYLAHIQLPVLRVPQQILHSCANRFADILATEASRVVEEPVPSEAEGTSAMFVARCFWTLSNRKVRWKIRPITSEQKRRTSRLTSSEVRF
jgi:hypothetical protein